MAIRKLLFPLMFLFSVGVQAQTVKEITVSGSESYTDHISLSEDSKDTDVMLKFVFDEENNKLTVSVLSYRGLFVFREPSRYPLIVKGRRLIPERLPYVADASDGSRFLLSKSLVKALPRPLKKYVFPRWIEYEGLQPAPSEYKMVNDYIEQAFDILGKRTVAGVTLCDLFLLDRTGKPDHYALLRGRNLNTKYQIRIVRNPCLGLEQEQEIAGNLLTEVKAAYENFKKTYAGGTVASEEALKAFNDTKAMLLTQFPSRQNLTQCPGIQDATDRYNAYVDSLSALSCKVRVPEAAGAGSVVDSGKALDIKMIYAQARQLDKSVARYLVSKDPLERADLVNQCREIIEDVSAMIARKKALTAEEKNAVRVYRQAEQYFKQTCGK